MTTAWNDRDATLLPCRAVLFDCDGVLVDSESIIVRSWTRWARQIGLDPDTVLATIHGRRSRDTVAEFVAASRRAEAHALIDAIEIQDAAAATAIPGAAELLHSIPADRWAIVTSGSRTLARTRLAAAGVPIPAVLITAEDVTHGKPHPQGYLAAADGLGAPPTDCVVVEDAAPGIRAARAANVHAVLGVGNRDLGDDRPAIAVPNLRSVRWTPAGLLIHSDGRGDPRP
ncbi:MAG: HAD-IA family hydrolase [Micropruina sp.]|uniref:HAD-IA family hydrolase n=1 Tax=Micropruina sp. TaxID=2737536 RepID=UPI0039E274FB